MISGSGCGEASEHPDGLRKRTVDLTLMLIPTLTLLFTSFDAVGFKPLALSRQLLRFIVHCSGKPNDLLRTGNLELG